ncbi:MAG: DedA family protein [Salinivirgaceae bacterium]|nr:DedA family protein [Salinivirgaceae bacterium]
MFNLGYLALFLASFLAATVVPFSSEAILSGMLLAKYNMVLCVGVATLGNFLGGLTSYYLGYLGREIWIEKYLKVPIEKVERIKAKIKGKEQWIAFFCWLPFVGDIIAIALGFVKMNVLNVSIGMFIGKLIRYLVVALLIMEFI